VKNYEVGIIVLSIFILFWYWYQTKPASTSPATPVPQNVGGIGIVSARGPICGGTI